MTVNLSYTEIAFRLFLTIVAGAIIGQNRGERGHPAGLRTTLLVCLAASISMIQVNLMLGMSGRNFNSSFVMNDLMRLPLGILSGMGFIGAGAILRREDRVVGVTTAATLWFVTVLGLCIGGGQYALSLAALAIAVAVLWGLKWIEARMPQERLATLALTASSNNVTDEVIRRIFEAGGVQLVSLAVAYDLEGNRQEYTCEVHWRARSVDPRQPAFLNELIRLPGITKVRWNPLGVPAGTE
jgi:putative Mg2+ transporter-C (MgtC) family protein